MCPLSEGLLGTGEPAVEDTVGAGREGEGPLAAVDQEGAEASPASRQLVSYSQPVSGHGSPLTFTRLPDMSLSAWGTLHYVTRSPVSRRNRDQGHLTSSR